MFDLDAYLRRIGLRGSPALADIHRAHATSIPFEGLGPFVGEAVSLDPERLLEKLVGRRRGGYCFEQNLLLGAALEALGLEVETYLARVMIGQRPGEVRGRTHLLLRVGEGGRSWHADVGFGSGTLLEPLPWGPGVEHEQAGWRFRVIERGPEWILQTSEEGEWIGLYGFLPQPVAAIDIEMSNWWTATSPKSRFVSGFLVSRQWLDGRRLILSDWGELALLERTPDASRTTTVERAEVPALLADRFELDGFVTGPDGRLTRTDPQR
ncbi:MAG TPA: arylamine N-acetyltransferase [Solirubrobacteraceae bacterium]|jgi:N-hydroxyarylamine O-acetyltransferase|nr:arylamine N-acetyltransferase [Solirubrobacteraceae bacterium]